MAQEVADVLTGIPCEFEMDGRRFFMYDESLGKHYLLAPLYEKLGINKGMVAVDATIETMRVVENDTDTACRIIAYSTMATKDEVANASAVLERAAFFREHGTVQDISKLLMLAMRQADVDGMQDFLGITKEHEWIDRCNKAKEKDSSTMTFCGKSVFGSLILPACEKLNMTPEQVIWGVSYGLLRMLMSDAIVTVYLTEKERRRVHIPDDRTRINADSREGMERILRMNWN